MEAEQGRDALSEPLWFPPEIVANRVDQAHLLAKLARADQQHSMIDLWCGGGELAYELSHLVGSVTAVDYSKNLIEQACRNFPKVRFEISDPVTLAFPSASFDIVTISNAIHHHPMPHEGLAEAFRVLRPGGRIVVTMPVQAHRVGWKLAWAAVEHHLTVMEGERFGGPLFNSNSPAEIADALRRAGFAAEERGTYETISDVPDLKSIIDLIVNKTGNATLGEEGRNMIYEVAHASAATYFSAAGNLYRFPGKAIAAVGRKPSTSV